MNFRIYDYLDNPIVISDTIVFAASRGARMGQVIAINEYTCDYGDPNYTITMVEMLPNGKTRKKTFPYEKERLVSIT